MFDGAVRCEQEFIACQVSGIDGPITAWHAVGSILSRPSTGCREERWMNNSRLLTALLRHLTTLLPQTARALLLNLALMVLALAQSPNCHLATLATVLPLSAQRENLIQRLRRWLATPTVDWQRYYRPLVK